MIHKTIEVAFTPDPDEIAEEFWDMSCEEQARFFNALGLLSSGRLAIQLDAVATDGALDSEGRYAMGLIGEYSAVQPRPTTPNDELPGMWHESDFEGSGEGGLTDEQYDRILEEPRRGK